MRWIFMLLVVLNAFYYVWHQQQAPMYAKEVAPLSLYQESRRDIQLLSESELQQRRAPAVKETPANESVCLFLGSFEESAEAEQVEQRLLSLDIRSQMQIVESAGAVDYWVYLPPLASRQASLRQLRELQARKIDSYIITQGDLSNGISLGIFPRHDSADSVISRLRGAGYEPLLRELPRANRRHWVRVAPESRRLVDDSLLERLSLDFKGLQHQLMPCEGVASPR
ncbi:sporulation protein [Pseudomonas daroniae]|uniref:Sporulation protein n=1 Tax=Phytopseudomonas daroniae TaxID=2487519 RepID=A0A4Q9QGW7_9GAMM|nr:MULTISPECIES: SPOR domain-containing protein [Pseudomonas]TBU71137.1 sporulation protein [Pseudomonas daroniae]TBU72127.1 sporulation protein [Pseudomonas daroniae]TBU75874.1 sporulation protein [Pseudomonas sp. FRB 228]TBU87191.1 sporulation protein [Pseudomonas daroniae]